MNKFAKAIAAIMLTVAAIIAAGCNKPDEPNNGGNNNGQNDSIVDYSGTLNGHDYVDLGLPSGTLWATCNVGTDIPEGYGDYFAWGETEPKTTYDWSTYKYCVDDEGQLTKYCFNPSCGFDGFVDDLSVLQAGDDAATTNWGDGWCTPTPVQWIELRDNTISVWTTQNGVDGRLLKSANGGVLFLPAAGSFVVDEPDGGYCLYWSNGLYRGWDPSVAWVSCYLAEDNGFDDYCPRNYGCSVRPVCSAK